MSKCGIHHGRVNYCKVTIKRVKGNVMVGEKPGPIKWWNWGKKMLMVSEEKKP